MPHSQKISGIMPVYHGSDADEVAQCLESIFRQTRKPDELVIIYDGPVSKAVEGIIGKAKKRHGQRIVLVKLLENIGHGPARNAAIKEAKHPFIAVFDSDDLYPENRLALQIAYFEKHPETDILGGQIAEFENTIGDNKAKNIRRVPVRPRAGFYTAMRSPLNNATVIFRREAIRALGGYRPIHHMEDYDLWLRALAAGLRLANLPEILAHVRIGSGMHGRRRGLAHIRGEWVIFLVKLRTFDYHWWLVIVAASLLRMTAKTVLPVRALKAVYGKCLRK